jgi:hypothetical protein
VTMMVAFMRFPLSQHANMLPCASDAHGNHQGQTYIEKPAAMVCPSIGLKTL